MEALINAVLAVLVTLGGTVLYGKHHAPRHDGDTTHRASESR